MKRSVARRWIFKLWIVSLGLMGCVEVSVFVHMPTPSPTITPTLTPTPTITRTPIPTLTPSGGGRGHIAFVSSRGDPNPYCVPDCNFGIYLMDPDGSRVIRLVEKNIDGTHPSWSPDGRRIAFMSWQDHKPQIYLMEANGANITQLTYKPAVGKDPAWLPDGKHIAFVSNRDDPDPVGCYPACGDEIYIMDVDGSNITRLTDTPAYYWDPTWSPDGSRIAFTSNRDGPIYLYTMDADGSNVTRLVPESWLSLNHAWSPDGSQIVCTCGDALCIMDADGGNMTRLTDLPGNEIDPTWSPDGLKIAFASYPGDTWISMDIYVINADGSNEVRLTDNNAYEGELAWQP